MSSCTGCDTSCCHLQVALTRSGIHTCSCETFRQVAGTTEERCLHTVYVQSHVQNASSFLPTQSAPLMDAVPIRPSSANNAQPYAYWTDGTFVLYNAIIRQLRCSHDSHMGHCPHIEAVNAFAQDNALDGLDDEEQDFAHVCCCTDFRVRSFSMLTQDLSPVIHKCMSLTLVSGYVCCCRALMTMRAYATIS